MFLIKTRFRCTRFQFLSQIGNWGIKSGAAAIKSRKKPIFLAHLHLYSTCSILIYTIRGSLQVLRPNTISSPRLSNTAGTVRTPPQPCCVHYISQTLGMRLDTADSYPAAIYVCKRRKKMGDQRARLSSVANGMLISSLNLQYIHCHRNEVNVTG